MPGAKAIDFFFDIIKRLMKNLHFAEDIGPIFKVAQHGSKIWLMYIKKCFTSRILNLLIFY